MKILALELSTSAAGLAWRHDDVEVVREWTNDRKNSGFFFENLELTLPQFGRPEKIIVGLGPGSYAGVRIAISTAIGLQEAYQAHLIGYPSVCAIESDADDYVVIGDARRESFYFARVQQRRILGEINLFGEMELKQQLEKLEPNLPVYTTDSPSRWEGAQLAHPSAVILARLAQDDSRSFSLPPLEPLYLREPHITMPKTRAASKRN